MTIYSTGMDASKSIIAPSILAADLGKLTSEIQEVQQLGADWIHIDVMDGAFVPPITFGDNVVKVARRATALPLDVHLMIREPERHLGLFRDAGADRVTVHQEASPHLYRTLSAIRSLGMKAGVAINPGTPVDTLFDVLAVSDLALVMTVNPGWGGQSFIASTLSKIEALREEIARRKLTTLLQVDGGIDAETAPRCRAAGASVFVAGSAIFGSGDREAAIGALRNAVR